MPTFRFIALGLLRDQRPRHGYAMMKEYRERSGIVLSAGNFYRELQRLLAHGLVRAVPNPAGDDPRRAPYEITDAGIAAFDSWMAEPRDSPEPTPQDEVSARTFFLAEVRPSVASRMLESWHERLEIQERVLRRACADLPRNAPARSRSAVRALMLERRMRHVSADIAFVATCRTVYAGWNAAPRADRPIASDRRPRDRSVAG